MFDLIVSQGRVADRSAQTIEGASRVAQALERRYGVKARVVGKAAPPAQDDWRDSLPQAHATLAALKDAISESIDGEKLSVLISNTCPASIATLPVVAQRLPNAVVLWVDAHGDFNTPETTGTGYLGGMVVAAACGLWDSGHGAGLRPEQVILVGARDIDRAEGELLRQAGVRIIAPADATPDHVLRQIGDAPVWVHVDWDVMEPGYIPADYTVPDGLLPSQLRDIFAAIPASQLAGVELAEFHAPADERDGDAAVEVILDIAAPLLQAASVRRTAIE
ncbi:arginase family protein [Azospirillum griseum]|uniref:Arginase family protein n=1 Tax=Azospirillum griseum TaxID=2496639 RepID=A0A431V9S0_9PROT|nr:arginase family protein [Azospirillum griseum]RTR12238.1 arginase family protein [Azospirillum griseum]